MASELQKRVMEALKPAPTILSGEIISWRFADTSPVTSYTRFLGELACKVNVQGAVDPGLVQAFLEEVTVDQLGETSPEQPLILRETTRLPSTPFGLRAIVHPGLKKSAISQEVMFMAPQTYRTFPAYRCEFTDHDTPAEALFRLAKLVEWSRWDREPTPALSARFLLLTSGVKSTGGKRMGVFSPVQVEANITRLAAEGGFIEIQNFERELVRIEAEGGKYRVLVDGSQEVPVKDTMAWFRTYATEGLAAAGTA